jgi:predicted NBD/HSP70 family sugar kinase
MMAVLQDAAQYLSLAVNAIITILNPPLIKMGGGMICEVPEFFQTVVSLARRNAWAGAWNETTIEAATVGREAQIAGATYLLCRKIAGELQRL